MSKKQTKIGIKFPITIKSNDKTFFDMDKLPGEAIRSDLMHLIFTPVGQRVRNPEFGTRLIQFIFNPNDSQTWGEVQSEIKDKVAQYIPNTSIDNIEIYETDNGLGLMAQITYTVKDDTFENTYQLVTRL